MFSIRIEACEGVGSPASCLSERDEGREIRELPSKGCVFEIYVGEVVVEVVEDMA